MPTYIDKDKMIQDIKDNYVIYGYEDFLNDFFKMIDEQPTVDAEPVRHGHWVSIGNTAFATCQCGYVTDRYMTYHYCPKCGAKMG